MSDFFALYFVSQCLLIIFVIFHHGLRIDMVVNEQRALYLSQSYPGVYQKLCCETYGGSVVFCTVFACRMNT